ncbi:unnamed protein product [Closterium sp. Naga37s-1]|nr:unnamed protein product [Closterium sp. Naga37s-1]
MGVGDSRESLVVRLVGPALAAADVTNEGDGADYNEYQDTPCDHSAYGRWLFDPPKGKYTWQLYPCAKPLPPPSEWLSALQSRGIYEINIVGDSHQRLLFNHLFFLLTGKAHVFQSKVHHDMTHVIMPSSTPAPSPGVASAPAADLPDTPAAAASASFGEGASPGSSSEAAEQRPLKLNFYWIAGIYNIGQYGCN